MAKNPKKKSYGFLIFTVVYAILFLAGTYVGLNYLWDFMDAFEASRPENTINAYMEQVTAEYVCDNSADLIATIDHHIQSEEACREVIKEAVSGKITYAKKTSECTDEKMVYVLRTAGKVIGQVEMEPRGEARYGFTPWEVTEDSFDLSYLVTGTVSVTAPHDYTVTVNGNALNESYLTASGMQYPVLKDFYDRYEGLPYQVSYTAGPCLGEITLEVADRQGQSVTIDENTDFNAFVDNCTAEEMTVLETFNQDFIKAYINFLTSNRNTRIANHNALKPYLVPRGDLAKRVKNALDGLLFGQSKSDVLVDLIINHAVKIAGDRYILDVTYVVDTTGRQGVVQTTNNAQYVAVQTEDGLQVEMLLSY